jgi:RNA polymerase sigma factor (sigma-70 family)
MMEIVESCIRTVAPLVRAKVPAQDQPDVLQAISLALHASLPRFRGEAKLETYAGAIARRRIADYYRRRERDHRAVEAAKTIRPPEPDILKADYVYLTRRETEVLGLVGSGASNAEICRRLSISNNTARSHLRQIYRKLGCPSRLGLALFAIKIFGGAT